MWVAKLHYANDELTEREPMDYFERRLDTKNRLTIPSALHDEFGEDVVITRGFGQYLHLYPKQIWDQQMEQALRGDILDERIADLNVKFRTGRVETKLDHKQGRIILEPHHLAYAGIDRDIIAVRAGRYFRRIAK
jgi:MraZ protein